MDVDEIWRWGKMLSSSGFMGATPEQASTLAALCYSKGMDPVQALERYHIIQGRPAIKADAMLADFQAHGGTVEYHVYSDECVDMEFWAPGVKGSVRIKHTLKGLIDKGVAVTDSGKLKANYEKHPANMLRSRCASDGVRAAMPAIISGIYTTEEVQDFTGSDPASVARDVTPQRTRGHTRKELALEADDAPAAGPPESASWALREPQPEPAPAAKKKRGRPKKAAQPAPEPVAPERQQVEMDPEFEDEPPPMNDEEVEAEMAEITEAQRRLEARRRQSNPEKRSRFGSR